MLMLLFVMLLILVMVMFFVTLFFVRIMGQVMVLSDKCSCKIRSTQTSIAHRCSTLTSPTSYTSSSSIRFLPRFWFLILWIYKSNFYLIEEADNVLNCRSRLWDRPSASKRFSTSPKNLSSWFCIWGPIAYHHLRSPIGAFRRNCTPKLNISIYSLELLDKYF